ncbi:MAG: hypothetical protein B0D96_00015 [Candidatus Sedimenticola endophacoides]|nr:MAG: hypothetical protein B0D96_00015 [Candidatus Sedimenticola endophacoides]PUD98472.1 MAG: hypothetical protein C3L26_12415 [Candidatus Sedimenticola endophacoides]PUE01492.1 MAG: hypothetical protein C3L25_12335 [Candidatus Sedimenticola endophacoides]
MTALAPQTVVPGHGRVCSLKQAQQETGNYLDWLITRVGEALDEWMELDETVRTLSAAPPFEHLEHFEPWHRANVNRTYLQLEVNR